MGNEQFFVVVDGRVWFVHPAGLETISSASVSQAVRQVLLQLYRGMIEADMLMSDMIPEKDQGNGVIYRW